MNFLYDLAVYAIPLIFAITMHEAAHGWMAERFGTRHSKPHPSYRPHWHNYCAGYFVVRLSRDRLWGSAFGMGQARSRQYAQFETFSSGDVHGGLGRSFEQSLAGAFLAADA